MRALTWQGNQNVAVTDVPDPRIEEPTDAIVRVTSTAICGSDLHLYGVLGPYLKPGDVLGHEAMGVVEEVGGDVAGLAPGDRVVVPFNIACGHCWMCSRGLFAQCETTQVRSEGIPDGPPDDQFLFLSDVLPTAWQAVKYADVEPGGTLAVFGLGPIGQLPARIGLHLGARRVIGIDSVPERLALAERHGVEPLDLSAVDDIAETLTAWWTAVGPTRRSTPSAWRPTGERRAESSRPSPKRRRNVPGEGRRLYQGRART